MYPSRQSTAGESTSLRVEQLAADSTIEQSVCLHDISLDVHAGEILGIGGLMGSGRSELLMHLYGLWGQRTAGTVWLHGRSYSRPTPRASLRRGLMLVTEDRKRFGLFAGETTHRNVSLSSLAAIATYGWISAVAEQRRNSAILSRISFRALSDQTPVERLSGGNQQKVVLARGLLSDPSVVLLDEPTRGVDVGARREIYEEARNMAQRGTALVWVSSELPELIGICDRIVILRNGTTAGTFSRESGFEPVADGLALGQAPSIP